MRTLEDILQDIGLKGSIDDDPDETYRVYVKLINLIYDIDNLTGVNMERVVVKLDEIMSSDGSAY